ncbi:Gfo/Idh/MocA family protein [Mesorhizobium australafricanum]|uniref:Gfo/Idh/MocA family oxidoreductase n=1 Tax=Mesorhizobium australafricanum TaxID=3072311 RepID=A0ABU4WVZ5_9HYPH|nr:Gfo/Idh/MocA family oxidoreductase [Mesorhizobium sp. VK3E]MDX8440234.1 Gfo/Idh/MocA family oxidoreductase [Mesorhizobium sp. VK3E]
MSLNHTIERIGRRIRVGVIGGGEGAQIAPTHRVALRFDDHYELVSGVLSSNPERSREQGRRLGLQRTYATVDAMLEGEKKPDGIDVVAIMTPNDTHAALSAAALRAGYHVICDKPAANNAEEIRELVDAVASSSGLYCVTYNYTGYPMIRQARAMVAAGEIGTPHIVNVRYQQGNLGTRVEDSALNPQLHWRLDPTRGGANNLLLDVGTHAHNLATFVSGRQFTDVFCDTGPSLPGRTFDDTALVAGRLEGNVRASISATKAATGAPQVFDVEIFGDRGGLRWEQTNPNILTVMRAGRPTELWGRAASGLDDLTISSMHAPYGHPEGFREAFGNIYSDFADAVSLRIVGDQASIPRSFPGLVDGAESIEWVEACVASAAEGLWVKLEGAYRGKNISGGGTDVRP